MIHDVIVLGAGTAGSAVAARLSAGGMRVALVGRAARAGWEGVSARSRAMLLDEGIENGDDLIRGPFARRGHWGGRDIEGQEWLIERSRLAAALRLRALANGAVGYSGVAGSNEPERDAWRVLLQDGITLRARLLVDARGRRGPERRGPLLLAVGRQYRRRRAHPSETRIEAANSAWCWWTVQGTTVWVQIIGAPRSGPPSTWMAAAAAQIPSLARVLEDSICEGKAIACAAHARFGKESTKPGLWRVGDAAMALDPLSGQGIYQSLRSARLVATAVLSVWHGSDPHLARRFVAERHAEAFERGVRVAAEFYRANGSRGGFWERTAAAYESVLSTPDERLVAPCVERRAVLLDDRIVEREVIVSAAHPRGVWQVSGIPVAELLRYLSATRGATADSAALSLGRPPQAVASAIQWLRDVRPTSARGPSNLHLGGE